jgi:glycerol-1-phosphate dehydrogenase [NAD(P)+]
MKQPHSRIIPYTCDTLRYEVENLVLPTPLLVVSDRNTALAAGFVPAPPFVHDEHHCFEVPPKADIETATALIARVRHCGSLLAVGSGTINDLCKYAAAQLGIPYATLATAPSMNGYVAPNASLRKDGQKQSFPARAPIALLYDVDVLAASPVRLIASGVGDTLCRTTVMRDAWLSHQLCGTAFDVEMFTVLHRHEVALLEAMETSNKSAMVAALMEVLIASGHAMAQAGSSAPASQGEHMLAHVLEMLDPTLGERHYHGEIIAVTTLVMARLQERLSGRRLREGFHPAPFPHEAIAHQFGDAVAAQWSKGYTHKTEQCALPKALSRPPIPTLTSTTLEKRLYTIGCPTSPTSIGVDDHTVQTALSLASFSRDRFTWLDMIK